MWDWGASGNGPRVPLGWEDIGEGEPQGTDREFGAQYKSRKGAGRSERPKEQWARATCVPDLDTHFGG